MVYGCLWYLYNYLVTSKLILNPYVGLRIIGLRFTFGAVVFRAVISATKNEATAREIPIQ